MISLPAGRRGPEHVRITLLGFGSPGHFNMWNNLSLETLAGDLRGHYGADVDVIIRCLRQPRDVRSSLEEMRGLPRSDILGISVQPGSLGLVKTFLEEATGGALFDTGKTLVAFGNQVPTYCPRAVLRLYGQAVVVRGEGEISLRGLVEHVRGRRRLQDIPNLVWRDAASGTLVHTHLQTPDLESLQHPPSTDTCDAILKTGGNVQIQASRGCPWGACAYCTRTSFRRGGPVVQQGDASSWQGFCVSRVLRTLETAISRGIREVEFSDDEFLGGRYLKRMDRIARIADGIASLRNEYGADLTFRLFTRPDIIYKANDGDGNRRMLRLLRRLKQVGLVRVFVGIEAGNREQLRRYGRGLRLDECVGALRVLRGLGLGIDVGFIMFDPQLSLQEMLQNVAFFRANGLISHNQWPFRPLVVNEGSRMVETLRERGLLGARDANFMSYRTAYQEPAVAEIAQLVEELSSKTRTIFYPLKVKAKKYFDPRKRDRETRRAQAFVEENGLVYLDLMERLALHIQRASSAKIREIVRMADQQVRALVGRVAEAITQGDLSDEDHYVTDELGKLGIVVPGARCYV